MSCQLTQVLTSEEGRATHMYKHITQTLKSLLHAFHTSSPVNRFSSGCYNFSSFRSSILTPLSPGIIVSILKKYWGFVWNILRRMKISWTNADYQLLNLSLQSATLCLQIVCGRWGIFRSCDLWHSWGIGAKRRREEAAAGQTGRQRGKCKRGCRERKSCWWDNCESEGRSISENLSWEEIALSPVWAKRRRRVKLAEVKEGADNDWLCFSKQMRWLVISAASLFDFAVVGKFLFLHRLFVSASQNVSWLFRLKLWPFDLVHLGFCESSKTLFINY